MNDRDLLELAAKAAGIELANYDDYGKGFLVRDGIEHGALYVWNPLKDDGDALRLAVRLNFDIYIGEGCTFVSDNKNNNSMSGPHDDDPYAATRRAVVRKAAEIGRAMK